MGLIRDPESPDLLRTSIAAWLTLTTKTTDVGSAEQFDRLSVLLGEHIIGSVWLYGSAIAPVILATVEALPPVVRQLGIGSARFLKVLPSLRGVFAMLTASGIGTYVPIALSSSAEFCGY